MIQPSSRNFTKSADGSLTIWVPKLDEHYHSIHGALTESQHVFIEAGLNAIEKNTIRLLEVGLGTALNARLTCEQRKGKDIQYFAIEKFPLNEEEIQNIREAGSHKEAEILSIPPGKAVEIEPGFAFELSTIDLKAFNTSQPTFDLVYFDAFAPSAQPELWTQEVFQSLYDAMNLGGALVTYCAKGSVKRTLKKVGFQVEALPGPPRKREMTRAWKR
jgi:tRNA U34 5-methylaminomethyl-2-thiouridine-forming methyltransferase MnmC